MICPETVGLCAEREYQSINQSINHLIQVTRSIKRTNIKRKKTDRKKKTETF